MQSGERRVMQSHAELDKLRLGRHNAAHGPTKAQAFGGEKPVLLVTD